MSEVQNDTLDVKAIIRKIFRYWWLFVITCTVAGAWAVWHVKTTPKTFEVSGVMLMSDTKRNSFGSRNEDFIKGASYLSSQVGLEDEVSVLTSFTNVLNTIQQLDFGTTYFVERRFMRHELYENKPFIIRLDTGRQVTGVMVEVRPDVEAGTYRVLAEGKYVHMFDAGLQKPVDAFIEKLDLDQTAKIGEPFKSADLSFTITFDPKYIYGKDERYFFLTASNMDVAAYYRAKTVVTPRSDESNIITISTVGQDTKKEKDYINTLMQTYIKGEQDKQNDKGKKTIAFIDQQLDRSMGNLEVAEGNLQNVQASAGNLVGSASDRGAAVFNDLSRLRDDQGRARSKLDYLSELITHMGTDSEGVPTTISAANVGAPSLSNLIDKYNQDINELATRRLTERQQSAPTIALARKVQTQRNQIIQSAQDARRAAQFELDQITSRVGQLEYQLNQLPQSSRQVSIATRKYELNASINTYLMEKRYEAEIAVNSDQVDKYVVDPARVSDGGPVGPKKTRTLAMALAVALVLPLGFILIRDMLNDRIMDLEELKRLSMIPVLGSIPASKQERIKSVDDRSATAEAFRTARINLQYLNAKMDRQVLGFTSSTSGEGKTFCAVNMAVVMALGNKRTLLMDADMRKPKVHERLGLDAGPGLSTYLIGEAGIDQIIRRTDVQGLDVITAGPVPPNPLELFESPRLAELMQQLRGRYDQVIVDASPMGVVSEFKIVMHFVDITLYVVRQGYTRRAMLRPVNELYRTDRLKHVDLLFNGVKADNGYGYVYG
ncbi:MAG TPA: polysaccharide biosynthesis tyrosine autokinase [Flavobacteriales bacterium]|nr:polysaccharide biosynthesis tyrosine autokinase [Flavobacteriales bacterium]HRO38920.1 polysaccharide biosynthesis tyrosine autokinase [Flavobacteriales bacterium]HRP80265.1 polysaccharide biosynthesis tyrosine autokinase [Flavobacteriales bacterium]HRQ83685.1 polysaccharide biosynthesis tyrosine autokinase [Flavobacteriales bacterium]